MGKDHPQQFISAGVGDKAQLSNKVGEPYSRVTNLIGGAATLTAFSHLPLAEPSSTSNVADTVYLLNFRVFLL